MSRVLKLILVGSILMTNGCAAAAAALLFADEDIDFVRPGDPDYNEMCIFYVHEYYEDHPVELTSLLREKYPDELHRCDPPEITYVRFN